MFTQPDIILRATRLNCATAEQKKVMGNRILEMIDSNGWECFKDLIADRIYAIQNIESIKIPHDGSSKREDQTAFLVELRKRQTRIEAYKELISLVEAYRNQPKGG